MGRLILEGERLPGRCDGRIAGLSCRVGAGPIRFHSIRLMGGVAGAAACWWDGESGLPHSLVPPSMREWITGIAARHVRCRGLGNGPSGSEVEWKDAGTHVAANFAGVCSSESCAAGGGVVLQMPVGRQRLGPA